MLALLPTKSPAPMMPPIEISATCRERNVRLSVGTAGGDTAIGEQFTQTPPRAVIGKSRRTPETEHEVPVPRLRGARLAPHRLPGTAGDAATGRRGARIASVGCVSRRVHRRLFRAESVVRGRSGPP